MACNGDSALPVQLRRDASWCMVVGYACTGVMLILGLSMNWQRAGMSANGAAGSVLLEGGAKRKE